MATRRELIVQKYIQTYAEIETHLGPDARLLPSLEDIDCADLIFFISIYFCGPSTSWPASIDALIASNRIALTPAVRTAVVAKVIEFLTWFNQISSTPLHGVSRSAPTAPKS